MVDHWFDLAWFEWFVQWYLGVICVGMEAVSIIFPSGIIYVKRTREDNSPAQSGKRGRARDSFRKFSHLSPRAIIPGSFPGLVSLLTSEKTRLQGEPV